jgi:hypothetical protein
MGEWVKGRAIVLRGGGVLLRPTPPGPDAALCRHTLGLVITLSAKVLETGLYGTGRRVTRW